MSYIGLYNALQTILWVGGFILILVSFVSQNVIKYINPYYTVIQSVMLMDIVHALLNIVKGSPIATIMQISSRLFVVWWILPNQKQFSIFNYIMFTAWSLAEVIRYLYYSHKGSKMLQFLRYNAFLILYPMGVLTGEVPLIYRDYQARKHSFNLIVLAIYVFGFPYLFWYMLRQRKANKSKTS